MSGTAAFHRLLFSHKHFLLLEGGWWVLNTAFTPESGAYFAAFGPTEGAVPTGSYESTGWADPEGTQLHLALAELSPAEVAAEELPTGEDAPKDGWGDWLPSVVHAAQAAAKAAAEKAEAVSHPVLQHHDQRHPSLAEWQRKCKERQCLGQPGGRCRVSRLLDLADDGTVCDRMLRRGEQRLRG